MCFNASGDPSLAGSQQTCDGSVTAGLCAAESSLSHVTRLSRSRDPDSLIWLSVRLYVWHTVTVYSVWHDLPPPQSTHSVTTTSRAVHELGCVHVSKDIGTLSQLIFTALPETALCLLKDK
jgi:hypothetical protein